MRDRRGFRIRACKRTYDKVAGKFSFNISYETHTKPTPRSLVVAEAFGLGIDEDQKFKVLDAELKIAPIDVVYITGDSGSGKSVLLRAIRADLGEEAIDLSEVQVDPDKPLIETIGASVEEGLELLSRVGLNDAFLFLRSYYQLSDGQKYRYRISKLIESKKQWWLMDEFAACLDRDTAKIIAFNLQKIASQQGKAVIAATTHREPPRRPKTKHTYPQTVWIRNPNQLLPKHASSRMQPNPRNKNRRRHQRRIEKTLRFSLLRARSFGSKKNLPAD